MTFIIPQLIIPGFALIVIGGLIALFRKWPGWFTHRSWYQHLPKFFVSTGLMLPIGIHVWLDGLVVFVVWLIVDTIRHYRERAPVPTDVLPE